MHTNADELRHADVAVEAWWWWGWTPEVDLGWFIGLELRGHRFDYWAGLVREGEPYLYVEELNGTGLRAGLEIKPPEMWAGHTCDSPFQQWSLGNEAHGVSIEHPDDVLRRPYGDLTPVTFDVEWYANGAADPIAHGYQQAGEFDMEIELSDGVLAAEGGGVAVGGAEGVGGAEAEGAPARAAVASASVTVTVGALSATTSTSRSSDCSSVSSRRYR